MDWGYVVGILGTLVGIFGTLLAFLRTSKNDTKEEAQQQGAILTELGYIKSGVDDIKTEQRDQRKFNTEITTKIAAIETATNRAHARLDRLEQHEDRR